jgi:hypothetical protein
VIKVEKEEPFGVWHCGGEEYMDEVGICDVEVRGRPGSTAGRQLHENLQESHDS